MRSQRAAFVWVAVTWAAALLACGRPHDVDRGAARPRNLVLVCMDTVRLDTFQRLAELDPPDALGRWEARALRLERVQSTAPWTLPAVASALTGLYPNRHGAGSFPNAIPDVSRWIPTQLFDDVATLPELLQARGFRTVGFVAHGWFRTKFGLIRGFDEFRLGSDPATLREATSWLARRAGAPPDAAPFFLYVHLMDAHHYKLHLGDALPPELARLASAWAPAGICRDPDAEICRRFLHYVERVVQVRRSVAALLDALERHRLLEQTLVILYSDHGEEFHDHRAQEEGLPIHPSGTPGEGHGHAMYQELLRVPVLIWHPGLEGRAVAWPLSLVDLAPTAFEWLGLDAAGLAFDGISLAPRLADAGAQAPPERPLFSAANAYGAPRFVVVQDRFKRLVRQDPEERLLFDLSGDPLEQEPVRQPEREARLDALVRAYAKTAAETARRGRSPELQPGELRALQELGYLEQVDAP